GRAASPEEAESALARISATPIITLTIIRGEGALARVPAATIVALAITPRSPVVGAHLAPPNGIGSPRLAPALVAACRFLRPLGRCRRPRGRRRRSRHLGGRSRFGFERVRLWAGGRARRGGHGFVRALRRGDAADGDCSNRRAVGFDADRPGLARLAGNAFAVAIGPGAMEGTALLAGTLDRFRLSVGGEAPVARRDSRPAAVMTLEELALGGVLAARSTAPPINARIMQAKTLRSLRRKRGVGHNKPNSGCT